MPDAEKPIRWVGSALTDLTAFPLDAKRIAGHQLRQIQKGLEPDAWRPMPDVGAGVSEIKVDTGDAFRVFYVAKFAEAIYVLHAFRKTTRKTAHRDIRLGKRRLGQVSTLRKELEK